MTGRHRTGAGRARCERCGCTTSKHNPLRFLFTMNGMRWLCEVCADDGGQR